MVVRSYDGRPTLDPWMKAMRRGDFNAAWKISDHVLRQRLASKQACSSWPRHLQFTWRGQPLDGHRILVRCYHGLGDTLQFARLLKLLRPRVKEIILWVQPALMELLRSLEGVDRLLPLHAGTPDVDYDVDIELMELPHILRLQAEQIPAEVPYISLPGDVRRQRVENRLTQTRRVGLCWSAGDWNPARSLPASALQPWRELAHVQWFALQYPPAPCPLLTVQMAQKDLAAMAAHMRTLDLVITVDTVIAHLAGALGLPVWLLLHEAPDWRWMSRRCDSPWYPTMTLFRRHEQATDWSAVAAAVGARLANPSAAHLVNLCYPERYAAPM
jgi:hypothetical protein